jgi:hypothetical protein
MSYRKTYKKKLKHIKEHPELHQHEYDGLIRCCTIEGCVEAELIEVHKGLVPQRNPGGCDVNTGPCSCGAWH